jgi:acetoacetyl-CoA synthetase
MNDLGEGGRGEIVWEPAADAMASSRIGSFLSWLATERGLVFDRYQDLWRWSIDDLDGFWGAFAAWADVRWRTPPSAVLADRSMPGAVWFPDGTLNWAEQALAPAAELRDGVAVIARSQTRAESTLTWSELADAVARCRAGLRRLGVGPGDRVCAYAPNIPETLIAFAATASLGAVWSSCAPEFGTRSVVDRFAQIEPVVLLAIDGYRYGEKVVDKRADVEAIEAALPSVRHTVHVSSLGDGSDGWTDLLAEPGPLEFEPVPFDHPLYVLYSSGTTGLPKAIVHGHGGITVEHMKTTALHHDLGAGDRFFWFTTTGWMMWN